MIALPAMPLSRSFCQRLLRTLLPCIALSCGSGVPPITPATQRENEKTVEAPGTHWSRAAPHQSRVSEEKYLLPPADVVKLLGTESPPRPIIHVKAQWLVQLYEQQLIPMAQKSQPTLGLAGLRFDIGNLRRHDSPLYSRFEVQPLVVSAKKKGKATASRPWLARQTISPPEGALFGDTSFSPDGKNLAVTLVYSDYVDLAIFDIQAGSLRSLHVGPLNSLWSTPCRWINDEELLCSKALHTGAPPAIEIGPKIHELGRGAAPALAYGNLLRDSNDDALFEHYGSISLVRVRLTGETSEPLPAKGIIIEHALSPDGKYILTRPLVRPYPRLYPAEKTQLDIFVHDLSSEEPILRVKPKTRLVSGTSVPIGPRLGRWDPRKPATLAYIERRRDTERNTSDTLLVHRAPFIEGRQRIASGLERVSSFGWTSEGTLYVTDFLAESQSWISYRISDGKRRVIAKGEQDHSGDPSRALRLNGDRGPVLEVLGRIFFAGQELSDQAPRPHLVSFALDSAKTQILWRSGTTEHAEVIAILDPFLPNYLLRAETPSRPPSFSITGGGPRRRLTPRAKAYKELAGVRRHWIRYRRADGVMLSAMLYLPVGFRARRPVPTVFWIYPREFDSPAEASLATERPYRYFRIKGPSRFSVLTQGYALLDAPSMPIIGKIKSGANDFLPQLKKSAEAAIDYLVKLGVSERDNIAVMGRSYGAFATANLMAHTNLFRTGIALSGAYNRTLTPFGFQRETRSFWQHTEAYVNMSPFFFADQLQAPLLLIHGEMDDNPGTPVLQSERFYAALAGNGIASRFVSFPFEGHRFRGKKAVLHSAAEIIQWLDRHMRMTPNKR